MATYTVQSGDTLGEIAARHSTTVEAIQSANPDLIMNVDLIQPGWELAIPGVDEAPAAEEVSVEESSVKEPAAAEAPSAAAPATIEYVFKADDSLAWLARQWQTSVEELKTLNGITDESTLTIGNTLLVPAPATTDYTVQAGDTIDSLAQAWGVSVSVLMAINGITDPNSLVIGNALLRPATTGA